MTNCTQESFEFPTLKRRQVEANFQDGDITSDGGVLLLRQVDKRLGLSEAVAWALADPRRQASCVHDGLSLLKQRLYGLALGYEDLNDHHHLREDPAFCHVLSPAGVGNAFRDDRYSTIGVGNEG